MLISIVGTSVAANARTNNILAGNQFEFLPRAAVLGYRASAAAAGLQADFLIGGQSLMESAGIPGTNRFPILPDDFLAQFGGLAGERLFLTYLNTTGAAIVVSTVIEIT